jgi:hypothetical protein
MMKERKKRANQSSLLSLSFSCVSFLLIAFLSVAKNTTTLLGVVCYVVTCVADICRRRL